MSEQLVVTLLQAVSKTAVPRREGGTYPGAKLVYELNGRPYTKGIHENALAKHPDLADKIKSFENRTNVRVVLVREKLDKFINIIDIREAEPGDQSSPVSSSGGGSNTTSFDVRLSTVEQKVADIEKKLNQTDEVPY